LTIVWWLIGKLGLKLLYQLVFLGAAVGLGNLAIIFSKLFELLVALEQTFHNFFGNKKLFPDVLVVFSPMYQFHFVFHWEKIILGTRSGWHPVRLERRSLSFRSEKPIALGEIFFLEIIIFLKECRLGILEV